MAWVISGLLNLVCWSGQRQRSLVCMWATWNSAHTINNEQMYVIVRLNFMSVFFCVTCAVTIGCSNERGKQLKNAIHNTVWGLLFLAHFNRINFNVIYFAISFQNCFGLLSRLCLGKGWKTFSHSICLRAQRNTVGSPYICLRVQSNAVGSPSVCLSGHCNTVGSPSYASAGNVHCR